MEESAEILELYPHNIKHYTPRSTYYHPHLHRPKASQQHLSDEEEEEQKGNGRRKMSLRKAHQPCFLSELHQPTHFYIGNHVESHMASDSYTARGRYGAREEDVEGEMDLGNFESHSQFREDVKRGDPLVRTQCHIHSSGRRTGNWYPARIRHMESFVKPKMKAKLETPLTESDSASLASSSDQQNSSTDQYIQVIHSKEHYLKSDARQGKLSKRKSKTSSDLNVTDALVSSNV